MRIEFTSLDSDVYELVKPLTVAVWNNGDDWLARTFEANVNVSADTQEDAIRDLKEHITDVWEALETLDSSGKKLSWMLQKDLKTLREHIRRKTDCVPCPHCDKIVEQSKMVLDVNEESACVDCVRKQHQEWRIEDFQG